MEILLILHLLALGIWIGVVGAEFVIELRAEEGLAARMHYLTDLWIEVPAFTLVLITGLAMLPAQSLQGLLLYKLPLALLAIVFNLVCVIAVWLRKRALESGDQQALQKTQHLLMLGGYGFMLSFVATVVIAAIMLS